MVYLKVNLKIYHFYYIHTKIEKITKNFACQINAGENILGNKKLVNLSRRLEDVLIKAEAKWAGVLERYHIRLMNHRAIGVSTSPELLKLLHEAE